MQQLITPTRVLDLQKTMCEYLWTFTSQDLQGRDQTKKAEAVYELFSLWISANAGYMISCCASLSTTTMELYSKALSPERDVSLIKGQLFAPKLNNYQEEIQTGKDSNMQPAWLQICHNTLSPVLFLFVPFLQHLLSIVTSQQRTIFSEMSENIFCCRNKQCMPRMQQNSQTYF